MKKSLKKPRNTHNQKSLKVCRYGSNSSHYLYLRFRWVDSLARELLYETDCAANDNLKKSDFGRAEEYLNDALFLISQVRRKAT